MSASSASNGVSPLWGSPEYLRWIVSHLQIRFGRALSRTMEQLLKDEYAFAATLSGGRLSLHLSCDNGRGEVASNSFHFGPAHSPIVSASWIDGRPGCAVTLVTARYGLDGDEVRVGPAKMVIDQSLHSALYHSIRCSIQGATKECGIQVGVSSLSTPSAVTPKPAVPAVSTQADTGDNSPMDGPDGMEEERGEEEDEQETLLSPSSRRRRLPRMSDDEDDEPSKKKVKKEEEEDEEEDEDEQSVRSNASSFSLLNGRAQRFRIRLSALLLNGLQVTAPKITKKMADSSMMAYWRSMTSTLQKRYGLIRMIIPIVEDMLDMDYLHDRDNEEKIQEYLDAHDGIIDSLEVLEKMAVNFAESVHIEHEEMNRGSTSLWWDLVSNDAAYDTMYRSFKNKADAHLEAAKEWLAATNRL